MFQISLTAEKVDYFLEELQKENWAMLKNYFIWTAVWGGKHNTLDTQNTLIIFLSAFALMQVIFWTEDNFCFISDCKNLFKCKLQKFINEQVIVFYSPSNALCSSDKSVQVKHFKHTFIGMCLLSTWFNLQILNNEDTTSLTQIEQMCKCALL